MAERRAYLLNPALWVALRASLVIVNCHAFAQLCSAVDSTRDINESVTRRRKTFSSNDPNLSVCLLPNLGQQYIPFFFPLFLLFNIWAEIGLVAWQEHFPNPAPHHAQGHSAGNMPIIHHETGGFCALGSRLWLLLCYPRIPRSNLLSDAT